MIICSMCSDRKSRVELMSEQTTVVDFENFCPKLLRGFWDFIKPALRKINVSGTVEVPILTRKSPTCPYIGQNRGSRGPR